MLCMLRPPKALYGPSLGALEDFLRQTGREQLQKHDLRSVIPVMLGEERLQKILP